MVGSRLKSEKDRVAHASRKVGGVDPGGRGDGLGADDIGEAMQSCGE
jgi:hypothetical protein